MALFRRHGRAFRSYEIVGWSLTDGPTLRDASALTDRLATVLESGDPTLIAACAGLALEQLCDTLSWTLPVSIIRKSDDKYTLGDLWPAIYKRLKKTELKPVADEIDLRSPLRNLVGAHYNEWAQGVSLEEARWFGTRVVALARAVNCIDCGQFVKRTSDGVYECKCRRTSFRTADSAARG